MTRSNVAIIVPTLGIRSDYLREALSSIRRAGSVHLVITAPEHFRTNPIFDEFPIDQFVVDSGKGLVDALNRAIADLPVEIEFLNWLGDDDLLSPDSIEISSHALNLDREIAFTFGECRYINAKNKVIGVNRSGSWATKLIRIGPDLIPQPGALIRRTSLESIGYISNDYTHAFDMDMFIKLLRVGKGHYLNKWMASFRWHSESLSVKTRKQSVFEASMIRRKNFPIIVRQVSILWEIPISILVFLMGFLVSFKSKTS